MNDICDILAEEVGQVAQSAEDGKAGHKGCEAVGEADEDHGDDNVLTEELGAKEIA